MDFETLWSRYRSGTAGGEEISQVEAELEKFRLLEAYIEEERPPLPPPDAQRLQEELRRARRQVRRRTARVAVGVLAAVLALGVLAQLVLFPAINRRAVKVDWSDTLKAGDPANLPATMQVFTALRIPRANFSGVYAESSGFGTEKLTFLFWDKDGSFSVSGRVTLGILHGLEGDVARLQAAGYRLIGDFSEYTAHLSEEELQARQRETLALRRETLAALPSGVKVYASIHFAEDLTFETLAQLLADWQDEDLTFENIRVNTYLSGVGFESGGLAAAHGIQKGFTVIPELHEAYHGEKVAFCTLTQLILENAPTEEIRSVLDFCLSVGLPVCFADLGYEAVDAKAVRRAAEKACVPGSTIHNLPFEVTADMVADALLAADTMGRVYRAEK